MHNRLAVPMGDPGCLSLFGSDHSRHRMLADHVTAEYFVRTEGRGRTVDEWKLRADGLDNHLLDCLVGAAVAANMEGIDLAETRAARPRQRRRLRLSEIQMRKRGI